MLSMQILILSKVWFLIIWQKWELWWRERRELGWRREEAQLVPSLLKARIFHFSTWTTFVLPVPSHGRYPIKKSQNNKLVYLKKVICKVPFSTLANLFPSKKRERKLISIDRYSLCIWTCQLYPGCSVGWHQKPRNREEHTTLTSHPPSCPSWSSILSMISPYFVHSTQSNEHVPCRPVTKYNPVKITLYESHQRSIERVTVTCMS